MPVKRERCRSSRNAIFLHKVFAILSEPNEAMVRFAYGAFVSKTVRASRAHIETCGTEFTRVAGSNLIEVLLPFPHVSCLILYTTRHASLEWTLTTPSILYDMPYRQTANLTVASLLLTTDHSTKNHTTHPPLYLWTLAWWYSPLFAYQPSHQRAEGCGKGGVRGRLLQSSAHACLCTV
jgi:hypothetical protein